MKSNSRPARSAAAAPTAAARPANGTRWHGRRSSRETRRDAILRSVGSVLHGTRLSSLTMQEIADELGITKGNLYYYFRDKRDILYQCHMRCMEISLQALREAAAVGGSPRERLAALLSRHIRGILETGVGSVLLTDLENLSPAQRRRYVAKRDAFERGVRELIAQGVREKEFFCDDISLAGFAMLGAINWVPKWYRPGGRLSAEQIADGLSGMFLNSLRAAAPKRRPA